MASKDDVGGTIAVKPLHVLGLVAAAYAIGVCSAPQDTSEADALRAQITPLLAQNDSLKVGISVLTYNMDSIQAAYVADRAIWEHERANLLSRADSLADDFSSTASMLREIGDATVDSLVTELEADYNTSIEAYQGAIATLEDERDRLFEQRGQLLLVVDEMRTQIGVQEQVINYQQQLNTAIASQQHTFRDEIGRYAIGALLGAFAWEMAR